MKIGRDFHRNQLDQRVPLVGDLSIFELAVSLHGGDGRAYDHITLSFSEHHVSNEVLQISATEFLDHALLAWPGDDRDRIPIYAEVHRPRLQSYVNNSTGEVVERFTHIHIAFGRHDLKTGNAIAPLGYLGPRTDNLKYIDAWQESFNARYGFTSPKNCPRVVAFNATDVIARCKGQKPDEFASLHDKRAAFEVTLQKEIVELNITSWSDFGDRLVFHGAVSKVNDGRFGECYSVRLPEAQTAIRLKRVFFQRQFIELATEEKVRILSQREKPTYREQMLPRKEPGHVAALLTDWQEFKAKEFRHVKTGTLFYKNVYLPASFEARLNILNDLERNCHGITSHSTVKSRAIATAPSNLLPLQIRDLDGIRGRTEMLLQGDWCLDVRGHEAEVTMGFALRRPDSWREESSSESRGFIVQPSSVLERALAELVERDVQSAVKVHFNEIEKWLDCKQLLANLKHSHGLNPSLYQVISTQDGTVRIQCGSRCLTPSKFLTEELGWPWGEAALVLQAAHAHQVQMKIAMQNKSIATPASEQGVVGIPLNGATVLDKAVEKDPHNIEIKARRNNVSKVDDLSGKAPTKRVGVTYKSGTRKSSRRGSDFGL